MTTVLALSPHLDDAAFSCGGTLAAFATAGHHVVVATVFTRSVPDPQGFALACQLDKGLPADVDYMALRRNEDAAAMRLLGAEPVWLDLAEAPHRGYANASALFAGRRNEDDIVAALVPLLRTLIDRVGPGVILGPRAVGDHVDHHAVREALATVAPRVPVALWTDAPYAFKRAPEPTRGLHVVSPSADCIVRKIAAAQAYASQIGFQFGGPEKLQQTFSAHPDEVFETDRAGVQAMSAPCQERVGA